MQSTAKRSDPGSPLATLDHSQPHIERRQVESGIMPIILAPPWLGGHPFRSQLASSERDGEVPPLGSHAAARNGRSQVRSWIPLGLLLGWCLRKSTHSEMHPVPRAKTAEEKERKKKKQQAKLPVTSLSQVCGDRWRETGEGNGGSS